MAENLVITPEEIMEVLDQNMMAFEREPIFLDRYYALPTSRWIKDPFSKSFWNFLIKMNAAKYVSESNDCDDFSVNAWNYARLCNRNSGNGIAVGLFTYTQDIGIGHARCFAICEKKSLHIYEPQAYGFAQLTVDEKWACKYYVI